MIKMLKKKIHCLANWNISAGHVLSTVNVPSLKTVLGDFQLNLVEFHGNLHEMHIKYTDF